MFMYLVDDEGLILIDVMDFCGGKKGGGCCLYIPIVIRIYSTCCYCFLESKREGRKGSLTWC
jgi:hypothetical protein